MLLIVIAELLELVSVTDIWPPALPTATLPHVTDVGDTVTVPAEAAVPVPESEAVSAAELLLLVMLNVALSAPVTLGVKTIAAVQLADAAKLDPQVVDEIEKLLALVPVIETELSATELEVVFETVMVCDALLDPSLTLPKDRLGGPMVTEPMPVPEVATLDATPHPERIPVVSSTIRAPFVAQCDVQNDGKRFRRKRCFMLISIFAEFRAHIGKSALFRKTRFHPVSCYHSREGLAGC
jgi:hypothetical protein